MKFKTNSARTYAVENVLINKWMYWRIAQFDNLISFRVAKEPDLKTVPTISPHQPISRPENRIVTTRNV